MKQRILTGILFALVVAAFIIPGFWTIWPPIIFLSGVAVVAALEIDGAMRACSRKPCRSLVVAGSLFMLLPLLAGMLHPETNPLMASGFALGLTLFFLALFSGISSIIRLLIDGPASFPDALATGGIMLYIAFPLSCAMLLVSQMPDGFIWLIIGLSAPWVSDVFAYFSGSLLGRRQIVPRLSPKKTIEGSLGGIVGSILSQLVVFYLFRDWFGRPDLPSSTVFLFAILTGLLLSVFSQLGDWLASGFKRYCGVKDFGSVLPGHGGLMDRFDSVFFTLPIAAFLAILYQVIGT
ncbi:MAG: phosphatidate cytidylyltransferase [Clostridiaceae bacterium]|jgi:phosphatidate cytidylyltransferase|nr:phosphatidate cytidylyltransferase [Eubacteriales bacterium]NLV47450.1 phosphatidate cytidylyltransferase [Clostridiaceae bacterium]